jgi:hypothetical protein
VLWASITFPMTPPLLLAAQVRMGFNPSRSALIPLGLAMPVAGA